MAINRRPKAATRLRDFAETAQLQMATMVSIGVDGDPTAKSSSFILMDPICVCMYIGATVFRRILELGAVLNGK